MDHPDHLGSSKSWRQIEGLFIEALEQPPHERAAFLSRICPSPALRGEVEALLIASEEAGDFLQHLDTRRAALLIGEEVDAAERPPGDAIGPYQIIRELGHGGMGTVYLAERAAGEAKAQFEQSVALKLIRPGLNSESMLRRFLHERQILARLQHPGIARLLDGGMTRTGQPYFAMEYVEGTPLTAYCDAKKLSVEARLRLFQDVVEAVVYAHSRLIIHRDLKPSNILVTEDERGRPSVKLLDFGIAKVLSEEDGTTGTRLTQPGRHLMTPEYAAPEQVRGEAITTATDVYALGVVLYELLTGHQPYRFVHRTPHDIERLVLEAEPEVPSTQVRRARKGQLASGRVESTTPEQISAARSTQPDRLWRRLSGDLDTIILKALRKEPERRYASPGAFAEDIRRHLDGLPVQARKDTFSYRAGKFIQRHRAGVAAAILVILSLVGGMGVALWQAQKAAGEAAKAEEVKDFVLSIFEVSDPSESKGETLTAQELLDAGAARVETELAGQPVVQAEMMDVMGVVYMNLGLYTSAGELLERALATRKALLGAHSDVAESVQNLATLRRSEGRYDVADSLYRDALAMRRNLLGNRHPDVAESLYSLSVVLGDKGAYDEAEPLAREALALRRELLGEEHEDVAASLNYLAGLSYYRGDYVEAESILREVLALQRRLLGEVHPHVAGTLSNLSMMLLNQGEHEVAEPLAREALMLRRKLLGEVHPDVAYSMNNLAEILRARGAYEDAEALYRETLALWRNLLGDEHPNTATTMNNLALVRKQQGDYGTAEALYRETLALRRKLLGEEHPLVAASLYNLASLLSDKGDHDAAEPLFRTTLTMQRKLMGREHPRTVATLMQWGLMKMSQKQADQAEPLLREALALRQQSLPEGHWQRAQAQSELGACLSILGRPEEAEPLLTEGYEKLKASQGEADANARRAREHLAAHYERLGKSEQATSYRLRPDPPQENF